MAGERSTSGAVHLTSLDLDISGIQQSIQAIESEMAELEKSILSNANNIQEALSKVNPELSTSGSNAFESAMKVNKASVEDLNLAYKEFLTTLSESKISKDILGDLPEEAKKSADEVSKLTEDVRSSGTVTKEAAGQYEELSSALKEQKGRLADAATEFNNLPPVIEKATGAAEQFVNKLIDMGKTEVVYALSSGMQRAFSEVVPTITNTENAVIELQRVLNDAPARSAMVDELYDIAYTYGQTFDVVQETAVKFAQTGLSWTEVIDATRATMLGLNTAELEVASATQGLISVLTQFHMSASELEVVIDKINITADNFPITSEKIVAALQRAGGTASAFGLSLEQTIGIITALGAATGRTGEAIGTALNSLISFSMKATSLSTFEDFLGLSSGALQGQNVVAIWKALADEIKKTGDSGAELAKTLSTSDEFMSLFDEKVAEALGLTEEFQNAEKELNDQLAAGQDIYSTVGTYRQNYFIALLNNIDMAIDAMDNMNDAAGYSAQENETAMEALSKKVQQLVVSLQELAVAFGEAGFLDFLKTLADISTAVVKFVGDADMLLPILSAIVSLFIAIKAQSIVDTVSNIGTSFKNARGLIKGAISSLTSFTTTAEEAAAANAALTATLGGVVGIISLVVTAIAGGVQAYKNYKQAQKEALEEAVELGQEATDSFMDLAEAYNEYQKALDYGYTEDAVAAQEALLEQLGYTIDDIGILEDRYGDLNTALQELIESEYELAQIRAENAYMAAQDTSTIEMVGYKGDASGTDLAMLEAVSESIDFSDTGIESFIDILNRTPETAEEAEAYLRVLGEAIELLKGQFTSGELVSSNFYQALVQQKEPLLEYGVALQKATIDYEKFVGSLESGLASTDKNAQIIAELRTETDKFGKSELTAADEANALAAAMKAQAEAAAEAEEASKQAASAISNSQSSYKTVTGLIEEYNKTGEFTADMMQDFLRLSPEWQAAIDMSGETWALNEEQVNKNAEAVGNQIVAALELNNANADLIQQMQELYGVEGETTQATSELNEGMSTLGGTSSNTKTSVKNAGDAVQTMGDKSSKATPKLSNLRSELGNVAKMAQYVTREVQSAGNAISSMPSSIGGGRSGGKQLKGYASGTPSAPPGLAIVGEQGPELVMLQGGERIYSTAESARLMSASNWAEWLFGDNSSKTSSGGASKAAASATSAIKTVTESLDDMKDSLEEILAIYEHTIMLMKRQGATADEIAAIYRQAQKETHELAEKYRAMGVEETSEYIRDLQKKWWEYQDAIEEIYDGIYKRQVETYENALSVLEGLYEFYERRNNYDALTGNIDEQMAYYKKLMTGAHEEAEKLRAERTALIYGGADESSEVIQNIDNEIRGLQKNYLDWQQSYFDLMEKKATNALQPFEDFISMADSLNLWDYLDFTKVDYLRQELAEINKLLDEGLISQAKYNELLKSMTISIYNAQKDLMKKEKESLENYYDSVVDGFKAEIETWKQRKQEVEDYYDSLIADLKSVEKENDRINQQVEYYNSRQKIITNLEQARARSGVAWREKEMEYQQQLIDLDSDWNKTQKDWDIEDQISKLEELKSTAVADIDATIEKINKSISEAEKAAEEAIARIDDELDILAKSMAESIRNGMKDSLIDVEEEYDKALRDASTALLDVIDSFKLALGGGMTDAAEIADNNLYEYLIIPMQNRISDISEYLRSSVNKYSSDAANDAMRNFRNSLIIPLRSELSSLVSMSQRISALASSARTIPKYVNSTNVASGVGSSGATVNITNYNSSANESISKTQSIIQKLLG